MTYGLLLGCPTDADPPQTVTESLAAADGWTVVEAAADVWADHRPTEVVCDPAAYGSEDVGLTFEVRTDECNWLTVAQPTRAEVLDGDSLRIELLHYELEAPAPAQAHAAVALEGEVVWEAFIAIPGPEAEIVEDIVLRRDVPVGADLQFHLHNHGPNSWVLESIEVTGLR